MDDIVYQRTKEQRDFWKETAENSMKIIARLDARVEKLTKAIRTANDALKTTEHDRSAE